MTPRDDTPTLELRISPASPDRYTVELRIGEREFPPGSLGPEILTVSEVDQGAGLFAALVSDVAVRSAWDQAGALHPRRRVRLRIDDAASELHALPWELLHDTSPSAAVRSLAADLDTPFSRHVVSPWEPSSPLAGPLRVLSAVAAPEGIADYRLPPIDRAQEEATLAAALRVASPLRVEHVALAGPCTLAALAAELERGYDVLHLVAHGAVTSDRSGASLFLERAGGGVERVDVARFARTLDCLDRSLRLVVLMSCQTATRNPRDPRFGFAPALLAAGVPAVLAMQDRIPMTTAAAFTRAFYEELLRSGQVDRAANRARRVVITENLPGNAVPALYATTSSLRLWSLHAPPSRPEPAEKTAPVPEPAQTKTPAPTVDPPKAPAPKAPAPKAPAPSRPAPPEKEPERAEEQTDDTERADVTAAAWTWEDFGGPFVDVQVVRGARGCLQLFGRDDANVLHHRWELEPGGEWGEWEVFDEEITEAVVVADARGRVSVFVLDCEGDVSSCSANSAGEWSDWYDHELWANTIAATHRRDGSLVLFATDDDAIHIDEQRGAGGPWDPWYQIDKQEGHLLVGRNGADHLGLFAVGDDGALWATLQRRPRAAWDDWSQLAEDARGAVVLSSPAGLMHLAAIDSTQVLRWALETAPGEGWSEWEEHAPDCSDLVALWRRDGALETIAINGRGGVERQVWRDDNPGPWEPLGGPTVVQLAACEPARGEVEVFALDEAGRVLRLRRGPR